MGGHPIVGVLERAETTALRRPRRHLLVTHLRRRRPSPSENPSTARRALEETAVFATNSAARSGSPPALPATMRSAEARWHGRTLRASLSRALVCRPRCDGGR